LDSLISNVEALDRQHSCFAIVSLRTKLVFLNKMPEVKGRTDKKGVHVSYGASTRNRLVNSVRWRFVDKSRSDLPFLYIPDGVSG